MEDSLFIYIHFSTEFLFATSYGNYFKAKLEMLWCRFRIALPIVMLIYIIYLLYNLICHTATIATCLAFPIACLDASLFHGLGWFSWLPTVIVDVFRDLALAGVEAG